MAPKKTVSIVIPAYNEEERLPITLGKIAEYFAQERDGFSLEEVIVVDDGSKDQTAQKAREFSSKLPMVVMVTPKNRGKGNAVRSGMLAAKGDYAFMYDADAATPIEELAKLFKKTKEADVVIGSRVGETSEVVMTVFRRFVGWCFHTLCAPLLPGIGDASCGAKLWSREAAQKVFKEVRLERFAFDIESLWLAGKFGFKIAEVQVNWTAIPGSKVSIYRDSPEMFKSVMGLYLRSESWKRHGAAFLLALLVGIIYIAPHVYFSTSDSYEGIYMSRTYDEDYYNGIIRQVYDGESVTQNAYNSDYKEKSISTMYNFPQAIIGTVGNVLRLSLSTLALVSKFMFPFTIFLVVYFFVFTLTRSRGTALIGASAMLLAQEIAPLNPASFVKTLLFESPFHHFLLFSRPINPQFNSLVFFVTLWCLYILWNNSRSSKLPIVAGVLVGISSYFYFFYWNFLIILVGVMLCVALFYRNTRLIKKLLLLAFVAFVVSLPYLTDMFSLLLGGTGSVGKNYVLTHRFIIEKVVLLPAFILIGVFLWNWIKKGIKNFSPVFSFLFMLVVAGFIASNQQVIHGHEVQQHHYHFMTNIPVFILSMSVLAGLFLERFGGKFKKVLIGIVIAVLFIQASSIQASSYSYWKPIFTEYQSFAPLFEWLQENSLKNSVVYSNEIISQLIPTYTHNNVYSALHLSVYPVPLERLEHNYFIYMYLEGVRESDVREYVFKEENRNRIGQHLFEGQFWRATCGSFGCFPDTVLEEFIVKYKIFLKTTFERNIKKYRINYMIWDTKENTKWNLERFGFLEEIMSEGHVRLYKVKE